MAKNKYQAQNEVEKWCKLMESFRAIFPDDESANQLEEKSDSDITKLFREKSDKVVEFLACAEDKDPAEFELSFRELFRKYRNATNILTGVDDFLKS